MPTVHSSRRVPVKPRVAPSFSPFLVASFIALVACCHVSLVRAAAFRATDAYRPACGKLMNEPPAGSFKRWSDWTTWGPKASVLGVPGRGLQRWADVTIPCGVAVVLDVPNISVRRLRIKGWLKIRDSPKLPRIHVRANYIMVFGRLTAGEPNMHFAGRLTFTLFQNFKGKRKPYELKYQSPADKENPRNMGHKTFAVVGGQVALYGMPGGSNTPSWVRLTETAIASARAIYVDTDVTRWAPGMTIALASTSADLNDAEHHIIASVSVVTPASAPGKSDGRYQINLRTPLKNQHDGEEISDGVGGTVGIYGEVALLDRHIVITGSDEPAPNNYDGGNFMVYMTPTAQHIVGVQFRALGNQGTLGKYPLHFHACGQQGQNHIVRKNAIVFTKQRCMVIHATGNMTIEENISYETKGHCYLLEEGSEMRNLFRRNLGINARKVDLVIPPASSNRLDLQTDRQPTTFWLATPFSSFIDNVAAGSEDSGFWLEANVYMRGLSRLLPKIGSSIPFYYNWGTWDGNHAHSNALFGFRTYPHGSRPRYPSAIQNPRVSLKNFLIYRNKAGIFFFNSERLIVENGVFLDNGIGIDLSRNAGVQAKGCRFIGRTSSSCPASTQQAKPVAAAALADANVPAGPTTLWEPFTLQASLGPLDLYFDVLASTNNSSSSSSSSNGSYTSPAYTNKGDPYNKAFQDRGTAVEPGTGDGGTDPIVTLGEKVGTFEAPVGVTMSQSNPGDNLFPNGIQDSSFHRFGTCSSSSFGITLIAHRAGGYWNTAMFVKGLVFGSGTNKFWATPNPSFGILPRGGLVARFYAIRDLDGSLLGQSGYAVANYDPILPPAAVRAANCKFTSAFSAYSCTSVCYRSVGFQYDEYGIRPNGMANLPSRVLRPYSYMKITRTDDGTEFFAYGTDNDDLNSRPAGTGKKLRYLTASLLAGYTYRIEVVPAETNKYFYPSSMRLLMFDFQGCYGAVTLIIDSPNSQSKWITNVPTVPCDSVDDTRVYKEYVCGEGKARLQLDIGANSTGRGLAVLDFDNSTSTTCAADSGCSATTAYLPPLSVSPLGGTESSFSAVDPFFDPSFYAPSTGSSSSSSSSGTDGSRRFESYIPNSSTASMGGAYNEDGNDDDYTAAGKGITAAAAAVPAVLVVAQGAGEGEPARKEALAAKDSAEALPELAMVDALIRALAEHLGRSSTSHAAFKELQAVFTRTNLEMQGIHAVRWLSRGDAIARFVKVLPAVVVLLELLDPTSYHMVTGLKFHFFVYFLTDVYVELNMLNLLFQRREVLLERYIDCGQHFGAGASTLLSPFLACHSAPCTRRVTVQGVDTNKQLREHEFTLHEETIPGYTATPGDLPSCIRTCRSFATELLYNLDFRLGDLSNLNAAKLFMPRSWSHGKEARVAECREHMEKLAVMFHAHDRDDILPVVALWRSTKKRQPTKRKATKVDVLRRSGAVFRGTLAEKRDHADDDDPHAGSGGDSDASEDDVEEEDDGY
ncbi:unnamed protein product [Closterium sp. NIES-54]